MKLNISEVMIFSKQLVVIYIKISYFNLLFFYTVGLSYGMVGNGEGNGSYWRLLEVIRGYWRLL